MAELDFYLTLDEELELSRFLLNEGATIIPDLDYAQPQYRCIVEQAEYELHRVKTRHFYVMWEELLEHPLVLRQLQKDGREVFYISARVGGPVIELLGSGIVEKDEKRLLIPGCISHHATYWNQKTSRYEKSKNEIRSRYVLIVRWIKSQCSRIKLRKRSYWIGTQAAKAADSGALRVGIDV